MGDWEDSPQCGVCGNHEDGDVCTFCGADMETGRERIDGMSYEKFKEKRFTDANLKVVHQAESMIAEYSDAGYTLSLRQLFYQFVSRDLLENSMRSYKRLGSIVTDGRMAGLLPWDGIEDRGREMKSWLIEEDIDEILRDLPRSYAADYWQGQDRYVEVWVEKDALSSVVRKAVMPLRVGYMACRGYLSASEAYGAGKRMSEAEGEGKTPLVIHLGDHDPSGIDMTRDNRDRLEIFNYGEVEVQRIALNSDQIDLYQPPPNPAKLTDSRASDYIARYGTKSWELDALEPSVIEQLIIDAIQPHIDPEPWASAQRRERENRDMLRSLRTRWDEIEELLSRDVDED